MKPGARVAAVIELLEELDALWQQGRRIPADVALARYHRKRRFIGSKDRREISRQVYGVLRHEAQLAWWLERTGYDRSPRGMSLGGLVFLDSLSLSELGGLFDGDVYCPIPLSRREHRSSDGIMHSTPEIGTLWSPRCTSLIEGYPDRISFRFGRLLTIFGFPAATI